MQRGGETGVGQQPTPERPASEPVRIDGGGALIATNRFGGSEAMRPGSPVRRLEGFQGCINSESNEYGNTT